MKNWSEKKLDDICELITCGVAAKPQYVSDGIPFLSAKNVKDGKIVWSGYNFISEKTHKELTKNNKPKVGDILYTRVGSYGEASVIEDDIEFSIFVSLTLIKVDNNILNSYYLKHYLNSDYVKRLAKKSISGSGVGNLNVGTVRNFPILLPPLPEQERIVSLLDAAFVTIAKAKANAEQNLKNAKELFDSYLQGVFENKGEEIKLSELTKDITDGDHMPPPKSEEGFPFITISNINKQNRQIDLSDTFKVPKAYFEKLKENRKPQKGDILYTVTGSYGIPVLIESDLQFCFQRHIGLIRPKENLNSKWLYYWILSPQALSQANDKATGTAQKTVSLTALRNFVLPKMNLNEQQDIVQKLDLLSAEIKKLETIYLQKLNDLEELKKSVLQKAFSGEL